MNGNNENIQFTQKLNCTKKALSMLFLSSVLRAIKKEITLLNGKKKKKSFQGWKNSL